MEVQQRIETVWATATAITAKGRRGVAAGRVFLDGVISSADSIRG
jgi:hypothetical protein